VGDLSHVFSPGSIGWLEFLFEMLVYKSLVIVIGGRVRVDQRFCHDADLHNVVAPTYSIPNFSQTTTARLMRLHMDGAGADILCHHFAAETTKTSCDRSMEYQL
jgi:hypothetical protein